MGTIILSFQSRVVIETLHNEGRSLRYIANYLGFSKTTIFNELHRLNSEYQAGLAQTDATLRVETPWITISINAKSKACSLRW